MQKQACGIVGGFMENIFGKELKPWQRKRKAGDGTVRQRKDGRWEGRIVVGYDDNGYPKGEKCLAKTRRCVELQKLKECGGLAGEGAAQKWPSGDWLTYWYENHSKPKIRPHHAGDLREPHSSAHHPGDWGHPC